MVLAHTRVYIEVVDLTFQKKKHCEEYLLLNNLRRRVFCSDHLGGCRPQTSPTYQRLKKKKKILKGVVQVRGEVLVFEDIAPMYCQRMSSMRSFEIHFFKEVGFGIAWISGKLRGLEGSE